jgi:transposase-like protein
MEDVAVSQESEGMPKARRRQFTAVEKLNVLREADACARPGELGALLRREGLYSSHLTAWRAARRRGELAGLMPRPRGPKAKSGDATNRKLTELERETRRIQARLERLEQLIPAPGASASTLRAQTPPNGANGEEPRGAASRTRNVTQGELPGSPGGRR